MKKTDMVLILEFLEEYNHCFVEFLEDVKEIEGTEAYAIIDEFREEVSKSE